MVGTEAEAELSVERVAGDFRIGAAPGPGSVHELGRCIAGSHFRTDLLEAQAPIYRILCQRIYNYDVTMRDVYPL